MAVPINAGGTRSRAAAAAAAAAANFNRFR